MDKRRLYLSELKNYASELEDKFITESSFSFPIALRLMDKFGVIEELKEDKFNEYFIYLCNDIKLRGEIILNKVVIDE